MQVSRHALVKLTDVHGSTMGQGVICLREVIMSRPPNILKRVMSQRRLRDKEIGQQHMHSLCLDLSMGGKYTGRLHLKIQLRTRDCTGVWRSNANLSVTSTVIASHSQVATVGADMTG